MAVGTVFGCSAAAIALATGQLQHFGIFGCTLAVFHAMEFFTAAAWREAEVNFNCERLQATRSHGQMQQWRPWVSSCVCQV